MYGKVKFVNDPFKACDRYNHNELSGIIANAAGLYLTISSWLVLSKALNGSLTNLTFLTFYCFNNFVSSI